MIAKLKAIIDTIKDLVADPQEIVTKISETVIEQEPSTDSDMNEAPQQEEPIEDTTEETQEEAVVAIASETATITPFKIFAAIFNGVGVGILLGLLLGLAVSPVVSGFIGALSSILGLLLGLSEKLLSPVKSIRIGAFGLSCVGGILLGIFIRTNNFLSPELSSLKAEYISLGYSEKEALSFIAFQEFGLADSEWVGGTENTAEEEESQEVENGEATQLTEAENEETEIQATDKDGNASVNKASHIPEKSEEEKPEVKTVSNSGGRTLLNTESSTVQNRRASVLFSSDVDVDQCYILDMADASMDANEIVNSFEMAGDTWGTIAKNLQKNIKDDKNLKKALLLTKDGRCSAEGGSKVTLKNCAEINLQAPTNDIEQKILLNGAPWTNIISKAKNEIDPNQYKSFLISITNSICNEKNNN